MAESAEGSGSSDSRLASASHSRCHGLSSVTLGAGEWCWTQGDGCAGRPGTVLQFLASKVARKDRAILPAQLTFPPLYGFVYGLQLRSQGHKRCVQLLHCCSQLCWCENECAREGGKVLLQLFNLLLVQFHLLVELLNELLKVHGRRCVFILQRHWSLLGMVGYLGILQVIGGLSLEPLHSDGIPLDAILDSGEQLLQGRCLLLNLGYGL